MNDENEVKVTWTILGRQLQPTILPYNRHIWPIAYSFTPKHLAMNSENEVKVK